MTAEDPFPMQSEEARRLEESTNDATTNWNTMETTTSQSTTRSVRHQSANAASETSFIQRKNKKGSSNDDEDENIYKDIDNDGHQSKFEHYLETEDEYLDNPINETRNPVVKFLKAIHKRL